MSSAEFSGAMNDHSDLTSPESNRAPPASSPSVQESPLFAFLRNLSPVKSDKISRYTQRLSMSSFPMPQPIFSSPQVNLHPRISIPKSEDSGLESSGQSGAQSKAEPIHSFWDDVQFSSPSTHIDEFLADPLQTEDTLNAFNQHVVGNGNGDGACVTRTGDANVESAASLLPLSEVDRDQSASQASQRNDLQDATGQCSELSEVYQTFALSFPTGVTYGGCAQEPRPMSKGSEKEYEQNHRGIRRNLQFETVMAGKNTSSRIHGMNNDRFPAGLQDSGSTPNFESLLSGCDEPRGISSSGLADDCAQIVFCRSYSFPSDTSRLAQNYGPASHCWDTESLASKHFIGTMIATEEKIMPDGNQFLANDLYSVSIPSSAGAFTFMGNSLHESGETLVADSITSATENIQHPCAMQLTRFDLQAARCENASTSEDFDIVEDLNQMSPDRNRKRTKHDNETEGCKRCNCKRSKCLKLYCECFAAGLYCVDNCSCENCMNKIEYEDTVLDTRKQIEHRNPLAFAPKVVQHSISSPANTVEEANQTTPSSARHKRGCNCKKSKCVKKYCECYQANVGCSEGCRCECCDNPFGRKAESTYRRIENQENQSHPQPDALMAWKNGTGTGRLHQSSPTWEALADITNLTPASHPRLGALASAAHTNWTQGSSPYSLPGHHHMQFMPTRFPPKLDGSLLELTSGKLLQDLIKEDDALQTLEHASTPRNAMEVQSSNQKCVSPQRGQRSNSSQGLRDGQKLSLQAMPSFPPLSPYRSKSPGGIHQIDDTNDHGLDVTDRNDQMQASDLCHSD